MDQEALIAAVHEPLRVISGETSTADRHDRGAGRPDGVAG
jgi:hypothetical protein